MSASYSNFGQPLLGESSLAQRDRVKRRRKISRSDEEIEEEMDIILPYRQGWPRLPPLPVSNITNRARNMVNNPQAVIEEVEVLCGAQKVHPINIYFAFRVPKVQQEGEDYHTLVVAADFTNTPIFRSLIIQIRKLLQQDSRHQEMFIEIIDHRAVHGLISFAIPPSEEYLLDIWQTVFDTVLEEIQRWKEQWITIEMLYRGIEHDAAKCPATVVITSPTAAADIWITAILPHIRERVMVLSPFLQIELLCGSSLHIASRGVIPHSQIYHKQLVPMGFSIGQRDLEVHSGTAGGMVKLSDGKTYALTNHHVVRNDDLDNLLTNQPSDSGERPFLKPGNPAFDLNKYRITCPSNEDNKAYIEECETQEQVWLNQPDELDVQQSLASVRADLTMARTKDRSFGKVHASSGLRTVKCERFSSSPTDGKLVAKTGKSQYNFILDWCLLTLHTKRGISNLIPALDQYQNVDHSIISSNKKCSQWTVMNNPKCSILREEVSVGKVGRTTRFTYGMIHPIPTIINPEVEQGAYRSISGTYGLKVEDCGHCMSFVSHRPIDVAVSDGDFGSIVLHAPSGDWLGLLFGETSSRAALFSPIDVVFRDIEKVTGHKVVDPIFNSN
ncbi:hypothetical protein GQ44DRAFT_783603 [Phaeosphaeriaceae sp. PMI808]|nr:hypothetical protein GQ44DRAFT_783603 [Phaeosphaeriaceae sp. PMI808]